MTEKRFIGLPISVWDGVSGLAGLIGVGALIIAGSFGAFEYFDRKKSARAAETLRMIEIWEVRGAQEAYLGLSEAIEREIVDTTISPDLDAGELVILRDNVARRVLHTRGQADYNLVSQYFTRLSLCIQAQLCSAEVADTFFADTVLGFRSWFAGEIVRRKKFMPSHGDELDWLICHFKDENSEEVAFAKISCAL